MKSIVRRLERTRRHRNDAGFTLVEVLITIVIVGMILGSTVAAFTLSIKTSTSANDRIKKSNDAQLITRFLVPDAASAGGYDDQNRTINESGLTPGVWIQTASTGGFCDVAGSIVRFEWINRASTAVPVRAASNYALSGTNLVRTYCTQNRPVGAPVGATSTSSLVVGKNITSAVPSCIPSCGPGGPLRPVIVTLTVTETPSPVTNASYTFSASGFVRAGGSSGSPTTATVPLVALGIPTGAPCPTTRGGGVPPASGVAVAARNTTTAPTDPFEPKITVFGVAAINSNALPSAACGQAGNIAVPTGWFATQTLVVTPGTCNNCGVSQIQIPAPINDPFADLAPPPNLCGSGSGNPATTVSGNERHYYPGVYHNAVNLVITGGADQYIFENGSSPAGTGVYIFCNGMTITSGILAQSKPGGVLFYFAPTGHSSLRRITTGGSDDFSDVNWQVDGRPEWRDIVFWQSNPTTGTESTTGDMEMAIGENDPTSHPLSSRYGGVIYAPQAQVEFYLPTRETLGQYQTVEATAAAVVARNIVADRISRIRLGDGPQTTVAITANPNPSTVGQTVTLQATVSPVYPATGTPTGVITFFDDSDQLGTVDMVNGVATFSTTTLGGGARPLKAIYSGDLVFASGVSPTLNTVLNPAPSTIALTSNLNPAGTGQPVTLTATVAGVGGGPIPTGNVTFYDDGVVIGSGVLSGGGVATLTVTLPEGLHPLRAVYNGDVSYLISTSNVLQQAVKQASVTVLTSSPNPSNTGQQVTLTATVAPLNPGPTATGTVTFFDGVVQIGGGGVVLDGSGVATLNVSNFTGGSHSLTARYSGDMLLAPSTSSAHSQSVNFAAGSVGLTSNVNPSALNQQVTFTATVTGQAGLPTPTGTIQFYDGGSPIGAPVPLNGSGVATRTTSALPIGSRSITAFYNGDPNYLAATSPAITQLVQAGTTITLASNPQPSGWGQAVTFTATVSENPNVPTANPTGTVNFYDNGQFIGQAALNGGGVATLTTSATWFDVGTHPMTATFVPTGSAFTGSTSAVLNQNVNLATTTLTVTSNLNPSNPGQSVTLTATVTAATPTPPIGTVFLYDNNEFFGQANLVNGVATFTTTSFGANQPAVGNHPITAFYPATANFQASSFSVLNQNVQLIATSVVVSSSVNPSTPGQTVTLRADITAGAPNPTGIVNFYDNGVFLGSGGVGSNYAVLVVNGFSLGTHPITAVYQATGIFANATSPVFNQVAGLIATTMTVTSNVNPAASGQSVTLTATVTAATGSPTGIVYFYDNLDYFGQATVVNGVATLSTTTFGPSQPANGNHPITASFQATGNFANTSYGTVNQWVGPVATTLTVTSNTNPSTPGQSVTFTATVTTSVGSASGTVYLYDNGDFFAQATVVGGVATITTSTFGPSQPPLGTHPITAFFQGNSPYSDTGFTGLNQRVGYPTTVALSPATGTTTAGQAVTVTATVNDSNGALIPTGQVSFYVDGVLTQTVAVNAANPPTAVFSSTTLSVGTHSIYAYYVGDTNFLPSPNSTAVSRTVSAVATAVDIQTTSGGTAGRPTSGDTVRYTFSQPMMPGSLLSGFTGTSTAVTARFTRGASGTTTLLICTTTACTTTINLGSVNLGDSGSNHYLPASSTGFSAATMSMTTAGGQSVVTITLGTFSGTGMTTANGTPTMNWAPSIAATDANGAAMSGTAVNETGTADLDF